MSGIGNILAVALKVLTGRELIQASIMDGPRPEGVWVKSSTLMSENIRHIAGTAYVLLEDEEYLRFTGGSAVSVTVPPNASVPFRIGKVITLEQAGAGQVTLVPGDGVTLNSSGALLTTEDQYSVVSLKKVATDEWTVFGKLA